MLGGEHWHISKLSHSQAFLLQAIRCGAHEMLFDAHVYMGSERNIYDNMGNGGSRAGQRTAGQRPACDGQPLCLRAWFCNPAALAWEKAPNGAGSLWQPHAHASAECHGLSDALHGTAWVRTAPRGRCLSPKNGQL